MSKPIILTTMAVLLGAGSAQAGNVCPQDPNMAIRGGQAFYQVGQVTNYEPQRGGRNGRCGRSATQGVNACNYFLDDHARGLVDGAVAAVPQIGGNSFMFGGVFHAMALEEQGVKTPRGCVLVHMADHYGLASNNWSKVDIVTRAYSRLADEVNNAGVYDYKGRRTGSSGMFELVGAVEDLRSVHGTRRVRHNPRAYSRFGNRMPSHVHYRSRY